MLTLRLSPCQQDVVCLGMPLKASMRNAASAMAPLPGIAVLESWMRKCPPKGGLVLCSLCVATWTNPDPSSAPSGTALQHVRNKALTTRPLQQLLQTEHSSISRTTQSPMFPDHEHELPNNPSPITAEKMKGKYEGSLEVFHPLALLILGEHRGRVKSDECSLHCSGPDAEWKEKPVFSNCVFTVRGKLALVHRSSALSIPSKNRPLHLAESLSSTRVHTAYLILLSVQ